jgi:hypothetical protein
VGAPIIIKYYGTLPNSGTNMLIKFRFYNKNLALDFKIFKTEAAFCLFSASFNVNIETIPDEFQFQIIVLLCNEDLVSEF